MDMYKLEPYHSAVEVKPVKILYELQSYHEEITVHQETSTNFAINSVGDLKFKQKELVDKLVAFQKSLNEFLGKKPLPQDFNSEANDKPGRDKEKHEAKKKVKESKELGNLLEFSILKTSTIQRREVNASIEQISLIEYRPINKMDMVVDLHGHESDKPWLDLMARIGKNRGVSFGPNSSGANVTISIYYDAKDEIFIQIPSKDALISGHVAIWKFFGSLLGIYSFEDSSVTSLTVDNWLTKAKLTATGNITLEALARELSKFLGRRDFLCSMNMFTLPDIVLSALFSRVTRASSNVELWLKRINYYFDHL